MADPISGSMAQAYLRCPRYFQHAHVDKRQPRDVDGNLSFGKAWHKLMEARWKRLPVDLQQDPANKIRKHELALLEALNREYNSLYGPPTAELLLCEERQEVLLPSGVKVSVKFDALVKDTQGRTFIVEHKTTSSDIGPESNYWEKLLLDTQISLYWLAAEALRYKVDGVLYDVVRKPQLRKGVREDAFAFTTRCIESVSDTDKHFARQIITRDERTLKEALVDITQVSELVQLGKYPKATRSCWDWFRQCEYHKVCSGETTIGDDTIYEESDYE